MKKTPISADLFDILNDYADEVADEEDQLVEKLGEASPVVVFCQNFYAQFFENELGQEITGIDHPAKERAVRLRRRLKRKGAPKTTILLVTWFEKLCDIYPDVLDQVYGGPLENLHAFYVSYVAKLLTRARAWAKSEGHTELEAAIVKATTGFDGVIDAIESVQKASRKPRKKEPRKARR